MCFPQQNEFKSKHEPMKTTFVPKRLEMRSTAENENYTDWDGPPNKFSHRRARSLLLTIIARLCATNADLWPLGGGAVGFPGGGRGTPTGQTVLPTCVVSHSDRNDDLRSDRE